MQANCLECTDSVYVCLHMYTVSLLLQAATVTPDRSWSRATNQTAHFLAPKRRDQVDAVNTSACFLVIELWLISRDEHSFCFCGPQNSAKVFGVAFKQHANEHIFPLFTRIDASVSISAQQRAFRLAVSLSVLNSNETATKRAWRVLKYLKSWKRALWLHVSAIRQH